MTNTELIERARRGERITKADAPTSCYPAVVTDAKPHNCWPRQIVCNGDDDVNEYGTCGRQWVAGCNFDDDMS